MQLLAIGQVHVLDDTAGHPDSLDAVFDVVDQLPFERLHIVTAIRGTRGARINTELAAALARHHQERPFDTLLVTDSLDAVDELDRVAPDEREAYVGGLEALGARYEHVERLDDTMAEVARRAEPGDLLVLLGAQGMRAGADLLRTHLREPAG